MNKNKIEINIEVLFENKLPNIKLYVSNESVKISALSKKPKSKKCYQVYYDVAKWGAV